MLCCPASLAALGRGPLFLPLRQAGAGRRKRQVGARACMLPICMPLTPKEWREAVQGLDLSALWVLEHPWLGPAQHSIWLGKRLISNYSPPNYLPHCKSAVPPLQIDRVSASDRRPVGALGGRGRRLKGR